MGQWEPLSESSSGDTVIFYAFYPCSELRPLQTGDPPP